MDAPPGYKELEAGDKFQDNDLVWDKDTKVFKPRLSFDGGVLSNSPYNPDNYHFPTFRKIFPN